MTFLLTTLLLAGAAPAGAQEQTAVVVSTPAPVFTMLRRQEPLVQPSPTLAGLADLDSKVFDAAPRVAPVGGFNKKRQSDWTYRFSFGPSRTQYFKTDMHLKTSKITGYLRGVQPRERHSMGYYRFWEQKNPFNFIDEPSNTFVFSAENTRKKYALNVVMFHPKFLLVGEGLNDHVHFEGEIDGQPADSHVDLNDIFGSYQLTKGQIDLQGQFQKIVPLASGRAGSLQWRPGAGLGVIVGSPYATTLNKKKNVDRTYTAALGPTGGSISLSSELRYAFPKDRLHLAAAYDFTVGRMRYDILDGRAVQDLAYQNFTVTAGWRLSKPKKK